MRSLIKFIAEESLKKGKKVTTEDIRKSVDLQLHTYRLAIEDLEELRGKTFQYDKMEKELLKIKQQNNLVLE